MEWEAGTEESRGFLPTLYKSEQSHRKKNGFPFKVYTSWQPQMDQTIPEIFTLRQFDYSSVCCARALNG